MKYIMIFLLSGTAYADDKQEEPIVVYKQRT